MQRRWGRAAAAATLLMAAILGIPLAPTLVSVHSAPISLRLVGARTLTNGQLEVGISETPTEGAAPLNVTFSAVATGGTGNYTQYVWTMGDGGRGVGRSIIYTFAAAGTFPVTVNVTDSSGASAGARVSVEVTTAGDTGSDAAPLPLAPIVVALVGGFALGGLFGLVAWRSGSRLREASAPVIDTPPGGALEPPQSENGAPGDSPAATTMALSAPGAPLAVPAETLRLSERVILHLARQPALNAYDVATPERTQAGMTQAFGSSQSAISNLLVRLAAAGVVRGETRHVNGIPRRVKVYELTPYGAQVARELRTRGAADERPGSRRAPFLPPLPPNGGPGH